MFLVSRKDKHNTEVTDTVKELTRDFFDYSMKTLSSELPSEYQLIDTSTKRMRDVYRHSLCLALDLPSKPAFDDVNNVYPIYEKRMRSYTSKYADKSKEYRMGILQLGVSCMVKMTNRRGGC